LQNAIGVAVAIRQPNGLNRPSANVLMAELDAPYGLTGPVETGKKSRSRT
jgi:hypothetical protein